jgi:endonuclease YncB( thermonuclease family)
MRLYSLTLLLITGLSPIPGSAGTLVGEWYQEDIEDVSPDERRAFSQPISQSTDAIQVTLGIKSPGLTGIVDFFLVVSGKKSDANCQYTANEIDIDSRSFPITSTTQASSIFQLKTKSEGEQGQLWKDFRKGQNLTVKIQQACSDKNVQSSKVNTFDFSLKGSSAAYRFVAGLEAIVNHHQQKVKNEEPLAAHAPIADEITVEEQTSQSILFPLLGFLFVLALLVILIKSKSRRVSTNSSFNPVSQRLDPNIGDRSHTSETSETGAKDFQFTPEFSGAFKIDVERLPRFKVEHVIDGDTVIVSTSRSKLKIRLDSIDCPEDGQKWGGIATAGLIKLIGGKHVHLEDHGADRYERTVATLYVRHGNDAEWININERMVTLGHAWVMRAYYKHLPKHRQDKLNRLERWAKSKRVGLWKADNPVPPWKWRGNSSSK